MKNQSIAFPVRKSDVNGRFQIEIANHLAFSQAGYIGQPRRIEFRMAPGFIVAFKYGDDAVKFVLDHNRAKDARYFDADVEAYWNAFDAEQLRIEKVAA
jgi:hypothetical protein